MKKYMLLSSIALLNAGLVLTPGNPLIILNAVVCLMCGVASVAALVIDITDTMMGRE